MDNPSTSPFGTGPGAARGPGTAVPSTQDRPGRPDTLGGSMPPPLPPGAGHPEDAQRLAKQGAEEVAREARELKEGARQTAGQAADKVKETAAQVAEQTRTQAARLTAQFKEQGASAINQQKTRAADLIGDCVAATRRASQRLHESNDHNLADYTDMVADRLDSAGRYLREQDAGRMVSDAADLARRKPEWVLGGAFVLGLAVARFLKSSRPGPAASGGYRYDDGYSDGGQGQSSFDYGGAMTEYGSRPQSGEGDLNAGPTGQNDVAIISTTPAVSAAPVTTTAAGNWAAGGSTGGTTTDNPQADRPEVM